MLPGTAKPMLPFALPYALDALSCGSTRARRRVFFSGDADGDAVSVTAAFPGLGDGDGSAANTVDSAMSPMAADRTKMCLIIYYIWFGVRMGVFFLLQSGQGDLLRPDRPTTAHIGDRV